MIRNRYAQHKTRQKKYKINNGSLDRCFHCISCNKDLLFLVFLVFLVVCCVYCVYIVFLVSLSTRDRKEIVTQNTSYEMKRQ